MTELLVARGSDWVRYGYPAIARPNARDSLVVGDFPDASNASSRAGVFPGVARTTVTAASQMPGGGFAPGTTYSNYTFDFIVTPPAGSSPITFKNCLFRGPPSAASYTGTISLAKCWDAGRCPTVYWDCTFAAQAPSGWICGINGHHFQLYRCDIYGVIDGFEVFNTVDTTGPSGVVIQQTYVHDLLWFPPGSVGVGSSVDGSHNDCGQIEGGTGGVIRGCNLENYNHPDYFNSYYGIPQGNACLQIKPDVGTLTGWQIEQNLLSGGRIASVNFAHDPPDRYLDSFGSFKRNIIKRGSSAAPGRAIIAPTSIPVTVDYGTGSTVATTNVYDDTMTGPVAVANGG